MAAGEGHCCNSAQRPRAGAAGDSKDRSRDVEEVCCRVAAPVDAGAGVRHRHVLGDPHPDAGAGERAAPAAGGGDARADPVLAARMFGLVQAAPVVQQALNVQALGAYAAGRDSAAVLAVVASRRVSIC